MMARSLTQLEIIGFLARHPSIGARVSEFVGIVNTVGYDQAPRPPGGWNILDYDVIDYWLKQLPGWIPPWGIAAWDDALSGYVVIFPDAIGDLRYTLSDNRGAAFEIEKPDFQSPNPPGGSPADTLILLGVVLVAAVVVGQLRG